MGHTCTTLWVKNSLEVTLSFMVFEIFILFLVSTKIQDGRHMFENFNFSLFNGTPLYYPVGQKFNQNRSISSGF